MSHAAEAFGVSLNSLIHDKLQAAADQLKAIESAQSTCDRLSQKSGPPETGDARRPKRRIIPAQSLRESSGATAKPKTIAKTEPDETAKDEAALDKIRALRESTKETIATKPRSRKASPK